MANDRANLLLKRIAVLQAISLPSGDKEVEEFCTRVLEVAQGALTVARAIYGDRNDAPQVDAIVQAIARARETKGIIAFALHAHVWPVVQGSLRAMKADIDAGIVDNVERLATGRHR